MKRGYRRPVRVFLLDPMDMLRGGLRSLLSRHPDFEVVGEASSLEDALAHLLRTPTDVVIACLYEGNEAPHPSAIQLLARAALPARVVVLSDSQPPAVLHRWLEEGAHGGITRHSPPWELYQALTSVQAGYDYLSTRLLGADDSTV